jgi:hypothetical protein
MAKTSDEGGSGLCQSNGDGIIIVFSPSFRPTEDTVYVQLIEYFLQMLKESEDFARSLPYPLQVATCALLIVPSMIGPVLVLFGIWSICERRIKCGRWGTEARVCQETIRQFFEGTTPPEQTVNYYTPYASSLP